MTVSSVTSTQSRAGSQSVCFFPGGWGNCIVWSLWLLPAGWKNNCELLLRPSVISLVWPPCKLLFWLMWRRVSPSLHPPHWSQEQRENNKVWTHHSWKTARVSFHLRLLCSELRSFITTTSTWESFGLWIHSSSQHFLSQIYILQPSQSFEYFIMLQLSLSLSIKASTQWESLLR